MRIADLAQHLFQLFHIELTMVLLLSLRISKHANFSWLSLWFKFSCSFWARPRQKSAFTRLRYATLSRKTNRWFTPELTKAIGPVNLHPHITRNRSRGQGWNSTVVCIRLQGRSSMVSWTGRSSTVYCNKWCGRSSTVYCNKWGGRSSTVYCKKWSGRSSAVYCNKWSGLSSAVGSSFPFPRWSWDSRGWALL